MIVRFRTFAFVAVLAVGPLMALPSQAQVSPATATLSACLVRSTTAADHITLARWIFAAIASHPGVADMARISDEQRISINKAGGALFNRLLTQDCATEITAAVHADGTGAIQASFSTLGEAAMQDLMGDPAVQQALGGMAQYLDQQKLNQVLTGAPAQ